MNRGADLGGGLVEVLAGVAGDDLEAAERRDVLAVFGGGVKAGDLPGQRLDEARCNGPAPEPRLQGRVVRQARHFHGPLDHFAVAADLERLAVPGHGDHAEIDGRRQAAVEPHFLLAEVPPPFQGGEIQKTEIDRLLDLVGERPGQEHDRDVRLADLHLLDRVRVGAGSGEGLDQARQVHRRSLPR